MKSPVISLLTSFFVNRGQISSLLTLHFVNRAQTSLIFVFVPLLSPWQEGPW